MKIRRIRCISEYQGTYAIIEYINKKCPNFSRRFKKADLNDEYLNIWQNLFQKQRLEVFSNPQSQIPIPFIVLNPFMFINYFFNLIFIPYIINFIY